MWDLWWGGKLRKKRNKKRESGWKHSVYNEYLKFIKKINKKRGKTDLEEANALLGVYRDYIERKYGEEAAEYFEELAREYLDRKAREVLIRRKISRKRKLKRAIKKALDTLLWGPGRI